MKLERFLELNVVYLAAYGKQQRRLFASPAAYETSLHCFARLFVHFPFLRLEVPLCNLCYYLKQKPPIIKDPQRINQNTEEAVPSCGVRRDVIFSICPAGEKSGQRGTIGNSVALQ